MARSKEEMGELFYQRRKELRLTRLAIGQRLGYSSKSSMVHRIEKGEIYVPLDRLREYAEILQVPVDFLVP